MSVAQRLILLATLALPAPLLADPQPVPASQLPDVLAFYERNLHFKVLESPLQTGTIGDGNVSYDFKRRQTFTNLVKLDRGFHFDTIYDVEQTNYDLDAQGRRVLPGRIENRSASFRFNVQVMKSTGGLLGSCTALTTTGADPLTGVNLCAFGLSLVDGKLIQTMLPVAYADAHASGGTFFPAESRTEREYTVGADGKVTMRTTGERFKVDPVTFALTSIGPFTPLVDYEVRRIR